VAAVLSPLANSVWKTGEAITFNASQSRDPDLEDRLSFSWVLGDGFALNGSEVIHFYMDPGYYQVILTVSDGRLETRAFLNLTISAPDKTVQDGGGPAFPFIPLAAILMAVAASGGGYMYWSRRRAAELERQRRLAVEEELAVNRPKEAPTGEEGGSPSRTSETSADEVLLASAKASADASIYAAATAKPAAAPQYSTPPSYPEAVTQMPSFGEIPEAVAVPMADVVAVEPKPMAPTQTVRPAARAPAPISKPPASARPAARPAAPATPARPATPTAPASPSKKPETLEEILAALKDH
jgi:hypothetical protein